MCSTCRSTSCCIDPIAVRAVCPTMAPGTPHAMAFQVTDVQKTLKGFGYPGGPDDLARHAEGNGSNRVRTATNTAPATTAPSAQPASTSLA